MPNTRKRKTSPINASYKNGKNNNNSPRNAPAAAAPVAPAPAPRNAPRAASPEIPKTIIRKPNNINIRAMHIQKAKNKANLEERERLGLPPTISNLVQRSSQVKFLAEARRRGRDWDFYRKITPIPNVPLKGRVRNMRNFVVNRYEQVGFNNAKPLMYARLGYKKANTESPPQMGEEGLYVENDGPTAPVVVLKVGNSFLFQRLNI
jgi:hypothetical protein